MTAFNVVRFRVKSGQQEHFIAAHRAVRHKFKGFRGGALVRTGEQTFCIIGEWANFKSLAAARPEMVGILDTFRDDLEDLGNELGSPILCPAMLCSNLRPRNRRHGKRQAARRRRGKSGARRGRRFSNTNACN